MSAYYNENDPYAAAWLHNLIADGRIAAGDVDTRSIADVAPDDLKGYTQHHFFAGIGGWSLALRLAGWPDDRPVWTGSCPCQPFSAAGKRKGEKDERHLWPEFRRLIAERNPRIIFGEQVASSDAIGRAIAKNAKVQEVLDRESVFGILHELQGGAPHKLYGLRPSGRAASQETEAGRYFGGTPELAVGSSWHGTGERGETPRQDTGDAVRLGRRQHSGADRSGHVRDDGDSVRSYETAGMERAVAGPDNAGRRVHDEQCARRALCAECDGEHMGAEPDCRNCLCDYGAPEAEIERLVSGYRRSTEKTAASWLAGIRDDLGRIGYRFGACVVPAAGVGAPHIRQRLWWVADADGRIAGHGELQSGGKYGQQPQDGGAGWMGDADQPRPQGWGFGPDERADQRTAWSAGEPVVCSDGKARRVEPGIFPLAHGLPDAMDGLGPVSRVGALRGAGNAIVPQVAAEFILAYGEVRAAWPTK